MKKKKKKTQKKGPFGGRTPIKEGDCGPGRNGIYGKRDHLAGKRGETTKAEEKAPNSPVKEVAPQRERKRTREDFTKKPEKRIRCNWGGKGTTSAAEKKKKVGMFFRKK